MEKEAYNYFEVAKDGAGGPSKAAPPGDEISPMDINSTKGNSGNSKEKKKRVHPPLVKCIHLVQKSVNVPSISSAKSSIKKDSRSKMSKDGNMFFVLQTRRYEG